jgi:hypothetical protein
MRTVLIFLVLALILVACSASSPFVGTWACAWEPDGGTFVRKWSFTITSETDGVLTFEDVDSGLTCTTDGAPLTVSWTVSGNVATEVPGTVCVFGDGSQTVAFIAGTMTVTGNTMIYHDETQGSLTQNGITSADPPITVDTTCSKD